MFLPCETPDESGSSVTAVSRGEGINYQNLLHLVVPTTKKVKPEQVESLSNEFKFVYAKLEKQIIGID